MSYFYLCIAVILSSVSLYAAESTSIKCPSVDHSKTMGPNRLQGKNNWCWALVQSEALSFALGLKAEDRISATDLAVRTVTGDYSEFDRYLSQMTNDSELLADSGANVAFREGQLLNPNLSISDEFGMSLDGIVMYTNQGGYCSEKTLSEKQTDYLDILPVLERKYNYTYMAMIRRKIANAVSEQNCQKPLAKVFNHRNIKDISDLISKVYRSSSIQDISALASNENIKLTSEDAKEMTAHKYRAAFELRKELDKACKVRKPIKPVGVTFATGRGVDANELTTILQKTPIMVGIDSEVFTRGSAKGSADHAALLVGSQFNEVTKQCEFKLRNSLPCEDYQRRRNCKDGDVWISAQELNEITYGIGVVYPKK